MRRNKEINKAIFAVSSVFNVPVEDITSSRRSCAIPRQVAAFVARAKTPCSTAEISRNLGYSDHSSFPHSIRAVNARRQEDQHFNRRVVMCLELFSKGERVKARETGGQKMEREKKIRAIVKNGRLLTPEGYERPTHEAMRAKIYGERRYQ